MASLLLALLASAAQAQTCWERSGDLHAAVVSGLRPDLGAKTLVQAARLGLVVTNGTFFAAGAGGLVPLGDVVADGKVLHRPASDRIAAGDGRRVDLSLRWGVGVDAAGRAGVFTGAEARARRLSQYLGGAGLLLSNGRPALEANRAREGEWGPAFAPDVLERVTGRTAVGVRADGALVVLHAPRSPGAGLGALAAAMAARGAAEAVFYDGGKAAGFSAGRPGDPGRVLSKPHPAEDLNPTHLVFASCR